MYQIETYRGIIGDSEAVIRGADVHTTTICSNCQKRAVRNCFDSTPWQSDIIAPGNLKNYRQCCPALAPVAQLDRVLGYETKGSWVRYLAGRANVQWLTWFSPVSHFCFSCPWVSLWVKQICCGCAWPRSSREKNVRCRGRLTPRQLTFEVDGLLKGGVRRPARCPESVT